MVKCHTKGVGIKITIDALQLANGTKWHCLDRNLIDWESINFAWICINFSFNFNCLMFVWEAAIHNSQTSSNFKRELSIS